MALHDDDAEYGGGPPDALTLLRAEHGCALDEAEVEHASEQLLEAFGLEVAMS
jgi:hypothetical protein